MPKSSEYWKNRWLKIALDQEKRIEPDIEHTKKLFKDVQKKIMKEIEMFYEKYSENEELTHEEAVRSLNRVEQRGWRMDLAEFRKKAIEGGYDQQLNREFLRSRVTRLQMLKAQSTMHLFELANEREEFVTGVLTKEFNENYMRSIYELHSQSGKILNGRINIDFGTYNQREIDAVLHNNWKGSNFSKRIWKNDTQWLPDELEKTLVNGLKQGHSYDMMAKDLNRRFDVARNRAVTLIQTETKHIRMQASLSAMIEEGVDKYTYVATLETNTCEDCGNLDNQDILIKDAVPGKNLPVIHPNCRCTIIPFIEEAFRTNTRWMRDPKTGEAKRVQRMSYNEWLKKYDEAA